MRLKPLRALLKRVPHSLRGDKSGTNNKELAIWKNAEIDPEAKGMVRQHRGRYGPGAHGCLGTAGIYAFG